MLSFGSTLVESSCGPFGPQILHKTYITSVKEILPMKFSKGLSSVVAASCMMLVSSQAFAAGGTGTTVDSMFNEILGILQGLSVVVVTIAVIWAGYKTLFKGAGLMEVAGPLMGAILIGAAPWLAELLVG